VLTAAGLMALEAASTKLQEAAFVTAMQLPEEAQDHLADAMQSIMLLLASRCGMPAWLKAFITQPHVVLRSPVVGGAAAGVLQPSSGIKLNETQCCIGHPK
jgi:hypothetical protein